MKTAFIITKQDANGNSRQLFVAMNISDALKIVSIENAYGFILSIREIDAADGIGYWSPVVNDGFEYSEWNPCYINEKFNSFFVSPAVSAQRKEKHTLQELADATGWSYDPDQDTEVTCPFDPQKTAHIDVRENGVLSERWHSGTNNATRQTLSYEVLLAVIRDLNEAAGFPRNEPKVVDGIVQPS